MKNKFIHTILFFLFGFIIFVTYKNWFLLPDIIGGDWPYYFEQTFLDLAFPPLSWASWRGNGFGGIDIAYSLHIFEHFIILGTTILHIPWNVISKIAWFGTFLLLMSFSASYLHRIIFPEIGIWYRFIAVFIYSLNTYILLVASGGQMGYALGYAIAPLVCGLFIKSTFLKNKIYITKEIILNSILFGFLLMIDVRITYMVLFIIGIYYLYIIFFTKIKKIKTTIVILLPISFGFLLNLAWILPLVFLKQNIVNEVSQIYTSSASIRFFSFADFSHALGLVHPNWPENIFGKTYFMKAEFLLFPMLAYSSLLFINMKQKAHSTNMILFFAFLGLTGAFLAKGANEPFGQLYIWMFEYIPGFVMFRDPTKWYVLIVMSYSVLIPFSVYKISLLLKSKQKFLINSKNRIINLQYLFLLLIILYLLFLVRPAFFGQLGGTFKKHEIPKEYITLATFMDKQPEFFRTMWVPRQSRFTYASSEHRAVEALSFYDATSSAQVITEIRKESSSQQLEDLGIKYIIVPYDSFGEIFQKNRKYNSQEYEYVVKELKKIKWLKELPGFGKIAVFQMQTHKDHFYLLNDGSVSYDVKNTTQYQLQVNTEEKNQLIFSENYNPYWVAYVNGNKIVPTKTKQGYMEFSIPEKGVYDMVVIFLQQQYYIFGFVVSLIVLAILIIVLILLKYKNFFKYLKNTL